MLPSPSSGAQAVPNVALKGPIKMANVDASDCLLQAMQEGGEQKEDLGDHKPFPF